MTGDLRLDLLGPLHGWSGDRRLDLGPIRQQALLAVLALRPNQVITPDELVDLVWGDAPPSTGRQIVPPYIYRLRKLLPEGVLIRTRDGYSLRIAPDAVDLSRFEALVSSLIYTYAFLSTAYTRRGQWAEALEVGRKSLALALESDSRQSEQNAHLRLAETLLAKGDPGQARPHFTRALELALDDGQESVITRAADGLARTRAAA
ncbi:tetratricopeptide repeat protein [Kribbella sp. NPDC049227]|uniref:AfsR/SARP family transcriptional regulator n=1 Tax=Kribbella sp. NPDC049227 TaxID=3364113 RepID=UPI003712BB0B